MQQAQQDTQQQAPTQASRKVRLGELLVHEGILTPDQVVQALTFQRKQRPPKPFGTVCQEIGLLSSVELAQILSKYRQRLLLGEILVHLHLVSQEQIDEALKIQKQTKQKLGKILLDKCWIEEKALIQALLQQSKNAHQKIGKFDFMNGRSSLTF